MGTVQFIREGGNFAGVVGVDGDMEISRTQLKRIMVRLAWLEHQATNFSPAPDEFRRQIEREVDLTYYGEAINLQGSHDDRLKRLEKYVTLLMEKDAQRDLMEFDEVVIADSEKDRGAHGLRKLYADELMFVLHRERPSYHMDSETAYAIVDWIEKRFVSKNMYDALEHDAATVRAVAERLPQTSAT